MIAWSTGIGEKLYKGVSAPKVYDEIAAIGDSATPEQIVEAARDESSELHKCFTWNDTEAADKWRKQEARQIRHFLVIRNDKNRKRRKSELFISSKAAAGISRRSRFFVTRMSTRRC